MIRTIFWGGVAAFFVASAAFGASPQDRNTCMKAKNIDQVIDACTRVIDDRKESSRNRYEAYNSRGIAWHDQDDFDRALDDYNAALRLVPNDIDVLINRARTYRAMRDSARAIREFDQLLKRNLNNRGRSIVYYNRGRAYSDIDEPDRAIADYNQAIKIDPKDAGAYNSRGLAWSDKGDHDRAIADFSQAIRLDPEFATAYINRGDSLDDKGELDRAIADFTRAIAIDPRLRRAYFLRGYVLVKKRDFDLAIADFNETIRIDPQFALAYANRCRARARTKRELQVALTDCSEAIRLDPKDSFGFETRGMVYLHLERGDDAISDYNAALSINPKNAAALYGRGIAKLRKADTVTGNADITAATKIRANVAEEFAPYGVTPPSGGAAPAAAADCSAAETHWKSAMVLDLLAAYEDHLKRFPNCAFATLAKAKVEALKK
jgi:tetratricopeptide (TPR) repeat protein